nr:hypothetical protein [Micromonospora sp. DSM 115978]
MTREQAEEVRIVPNPVEAGRPVLGVRFGNDWYFTYHALSSGGGDAAGMIRAVDDAVESWSPNYDWTVAGDVNTDPATLEQRLDNFAVPPVYQIYRPRRATHHSGGELDYAVSSTFISRHPVNVLSRSSADHNPVAIGGLRAPTTTPSPLPTPSARVLAGGDSQTHGHGGSDGNGWLPAVGAALVQFIGAVIIGVSLLARDVDLVGSQRSGTHAHVEHEAYPGQTIAEVTPKLERAVARYRPNIVTVLLGANDMRLGQQD